MARREIEPGQELSAAHAQRLPDSASQAERDALRYRLLFEHLNVGVFVSSLDGRMLECNDRTAQMAGESREALLTQELITRYEDPNDRLRLVAELRSTGSVRNFETWTRQHGGRRMASSMNAVLAPIGPNGALQILGMLEDITDRKLAEERAGEGEAALSSDRRAIDARHIDFPRQRDPVRQPSRLGHQRLLRRRDADLDQHRLRARDSPR